MFGFGNIAGLGGLTPLPPSIKDDSLVDKPGQLKQEIVVKSKSGALIIGPAIDPKRDNTTLVPGGGIKVEEKINPGKSVQFGEPLIGSSYRLRMRVSISTLVFRLPISTLEIQEEILMTQFRNQKQVGFQPHC